MSYTVARMSYIVHTYLWIQKPPQLSGMGITWTKTISHIIHDPIRSSMALHMNEYNDECTIHHCWPAPFNSLFNWYKTQQPIDITLHSKALQPFNTLSAFQRSQLISCCTKHQSRLKSSKQTWTSHANWRFLLFWLVLFL